MVDPEKVKSAKAVVIKKDDNLKLYWVGKKVFFLNTHERENNHGKPNHEAVVTGFQYSPKNHIVMVKGTYMQNGKSRKLSKIVGSYSDDQTLADEYVKNGTVPKSAAGDA
jgi:hypothetical protein